MLDLKLLTRNFHDQLFEKIEIKGVDLITYIASYECGTKYFYDGLCENRMSTSTSPEVLRKLKIQFYNAKNIDTEFNFHFKGALDIYQLSVRKNHVEFRLYDEAGNANFLSFDCDGFDMDYME